MDMWDPFIKAVKESVPHMKIVYDLFHVVSAFNKVIDKVRNSEYTKASAGDKLVIKGSRYLLLKNRQKDEEDRNHLRRLLQLNETISTVMILRDKLKRIWKFKYRAWANKAIDDWWRLAQTIDHPEVKKFARRLDKYRDGILNHCNYAIHNSKLEGINNKIKVIKRDAYGYHDENYFILKVKQAFDYDDSNN